MRRIRSPGFARRLPAVVTRLFAVMLAASLPWLAAPAMAAANDSKGTDYWVMFNSNYDNNGGSREIFIAADVDTTGTVTIPGMGFSQNFSAAAGTVATVVVPVDANVSQADGIEAKGIHITTDNEVSVYGLNRIPFTTDAYLALPTDALGSDYLVLGYTNAGFSPNNTNNTLFGVVATVDNTTVTITPSVAAGVRAAGVAYDITLDRGEAYQLRTGTANADLSGSVVTSDQPVAVFGGHSCANVPNGQTVACDHVIEQLTPTSAWGKHFATVPLAGRFNGDTFRILAAEDGTTVAINGANVATLDRGAVHQQIVAGNSEILASAPVLVAQMANGGSYDSTVSDPFMMLVPPLEQFIGQYTITTPSAGFVTNTVNLVVPDAAVGAVTRNGVAIPATAFSAIASSGLSGAQVPIALGAHTFAGPLPFGVFVYGFDTYDSYGYPGGMSLSEVARVAALSLAPPSDSHFIGTQGCVAGTVSDQNAAPLPDIRVDFSVAGVNPTSGFAFTNAGGEAAFCYTGSNIGNDTITASVAGFTDTATKTWLDPVLDVIIDIRPLFAPNGFTCGAPGVVQVLVFGSGLVDVNQINPLTVRLERLDGTGTPVGPPRVSKINDRGNPVDAGRNRAFHPDGIDDVDMGFDTRAVSTLIGCAALNVNQTSAHLIVTGELHDGTKFISSNTDNLLIQGKR